MILPVIAFAGGHENVLRVGVANGASTLDPGRDHSNVGSQGFLPLLHVVVESLHLASYATPTKGYTLSLRWRKISKKTAVV